MTKDERNVLARSTEKMSEILKDLNKVMKVWEKRLSDGGEEIVRVQVINLGCAIDSLKEAKNDLFDI